jgi:hypothetical protein
MSDLACGVKQSTFTGGQIRVNQKMDNVPQ